MRKMLLMIHPKLSTFWRPYLKIFPAHVDSSLCILHIIHGAVCLQGEDVSYVVFLQIVLQSKTKRMIIHHSSLDWISSSAVACWIIICINQRASMARTWCTIYECFGFSWLYL
jgi:hypothetical protein